ncbi:alpha/beta fold hydrolase [uncultured Aquabacterium sp.]|uniref:alpha/beta fold hydrolase n=1 Tax=Aquabacterium sp. TaxID=1872578 RepID=UPI0025DA3EAF|nr:alpha/beta fold hydrolase [uncultured Aquabacterium sp.]
MSVPPSLSPNDGQPLASGWLDVGDGHRLWWSRHGTPGGHPAVVLHGGPGSGSSTRHLAFFDLTRWDVTLFDQRGCGQSEPLGCIEHNTLPHLVADVEALRRHLGLPAWLLVGGSWGATLALAYVARHRASCRGVLLRGTFLGDAADLAWFLHGARALRPETHTDFTQGQPVHTLLDQYHVAIHHGTPDQARAALRRWLSWEAALESPLQEAGPTVTLPAEGSPEAARLLARARIQTHYLLHGCFLPPDGLLAQAHALSTLPCAVLHGRQDLVCRPLNGWAVHKTWPGSVMHWVTEAGHAPFHPAMERAMRHQLAHFAECGRFAVLPHTPKETA